MMIVRIRALIRLIAFLLATVGVYSLWLLGHMVVGRQPYPALKWRNFVFRLWARYVRAIVNMRLTVEGEPPRCPFFLVSNHLSYVDVIALGSLMDCTFVAKSDIEHWPMLGYMGGRLDNIFIDRANAGDLPRVVGLIDKVLDEHKGIVLFAEGTSTQGAEVLPFLPSLLDPAARRNFPVSYASISYRTPPDQPPAHMCICWWGGMSFRKHLFALFHIPSFEATVRFGTAPIRARNRKALAKQLHQAVVEQFEPVVQHENGSETTTVATYQSMERDTKRTHTR